jgi:selenocysteine lyase/cysteine desulfurase
VRYEYRTHLLDASRHVVEDLLCAPRDTCVLVPNTTNGIETVLRSVAYRAGDVVITFATIYEAFANTLTYLAQTTPLHTASIDYILPVSDASICAALEAAIVAARAAGQTPRLVLFDTINALPGVRMPFERLTALCRAHGVLSCINGVHGIGQLPRNLGVLDPDFFVTSCHKWLYVPRGCGVLYVPQRNQSLLRSTLPTSFGFRQGFVADFANLGTLDDSSYLCIPAAIRWRATLTWQGWTGEEAIIAYGLHLARTGGQIVADILGTEVLENDEGTLGNCAMTNIRLPLALSPAACDATTPKDVGSWIMETRITKRSTSVSVFPYAGAWWVRLSAPVYITCEDFRTAGLQLRKICEHLKTRT